MTIKTEKLSFAFLFATYILLMLIQPYRYDTVCKEVNDEYANKDFQFQSDSNNGIPLFGHTENICSVNSVSPVTFIRHNPHNPISSIQITEQDALNYTKRYLFLAKVIFTRLEIRSIIFPSHYFW